MSKTELIQFRVTKEEKEALMKAAKKENLPVSQFVLNAVSEVPEQDIPLKQNLARDLCVLNRLIVSMEDQDQKQTFLAWSKTVWQYLK